MLTVAPNQLPRGCDAEGAVRRAASRAADRSGRDCGMLAVMEDTRARAADALRGCGGTGALTCWDCCRSRSGRRHLLDGLEAADEAVTGVEREVTGGVFAG